MGALKEIVKEKIKKHAIKELKRQNAVGVFNAYLCIEELTGDTGKDKFVESVKLKNEPSQMPQALLLVDLTPNRNWGHDCQYWLYDANTGDYLETLDCRFPPKDYFSAPENYEAIIPLVQPNVVAMGKPVMPGKPLKKLVGKVTGKRYALLFSGMSNNRHLNDLEYLYRVLIDEYGFDASNITVLNYDGTVNYSGQPQPVEEWPGDNTPYRIKVDGQGSKAALESALDSLAGKLKSDDLLLIHTNNHGGGPTSSTDPTPCTLCCYPDWDSLTAAEFGRKLNTFPEFAVLVVMMEQCHSGGFSQPTLDNTEARETEFSAACLATRSSMGGADFDPFAYEWIYKIKDKVSVHDAFLYAEDNTDPYDTPNEADKPVGCGKEIYLQ